MKKNKINKSLALLLLGFQFAITGWAANDITIKGKVINSANRSAQAGARIVYAGTDRVTMSGADGTFELSAKALNGMLQVEAPGYDYQVVPVQGRQIINIYLVPVSNHEAYYNENSLSAANDARISSTSFTKGGTDLAGELAVMGSLHATSHSGADASGVATFLRGIKSVNMNSQPLFIVDGIEWQSQDNISSLHDGYFSNPLALLSPDDIESVQVLKNGTAIYGAKAAGGVVIINTRRAHNMATEITVNLSAGIKSPYQTMPMMNAHDYRIYATDVMRGATGTLADQLSSLKFTNDDANSSSYAATHNNTDWVNELSQSAVTQNYNIGIRGGDERALYAFSLGYNHNDGNIDNTSFERLFVRFNSDINLTKNLTTRADISFSQVTRNLFDDGMNEYTSPTYLSYIKSPLYNAHQFDANGNLFDRISDKDELSIGNPLAITENAEGKSKNYRFTAFLQPRYTFSDKFALVGTAAFSWDKIKESAFTPDFGLNEIQFYNEQGDWYGQGDNMVATLMTRHSNISLGIHGDYTPLKGDNNLNLKLGWRYQNDTFTSSYGQGYNTGSDKLKGLSVTNASLRSNGGVSDGWREVDAYATADYNYLNRYFLSGQASLTSNSRFGHHVDGGLSLGDVSWGFFPSATAAWVVTGEEWMSRLNAINYLRLHATYEITGNQDLPSSATRTYWSSIRYVGLARGLQLSNIGNDKLGWETTRTASFGLDMNLFSNRLSLGADVYVANTSNLLVQKQLRDEYGLQNYFANDGKLRNTGFDISARARVIDTQDLKLNLGATFGHYDNKVTELGSKAFTTSVAGGEVLTAEGNPVGVFYGYKALGVFATQAEADAADLGIISSTGKRIAFAAGDMMYEDVNHDGIIGEADKQIIGDPNPDFYGNIHMNLQYKRFALNALCTYSLGNDAYNALRAQLESGSSLNNQTTNMKQRWTADGQITSVPRATYGDPMGNSAFSSRWIEDASYLKLRQVSASYDLPVKPKFIQSAQIWAAVSNVFTLTKYVGNDPEFAYGNTSLYQGIDTGLIPSARSYHIGVKLGL
jgi:TonB-linked SusC/RagA family outer membrane protein